MKKTDPNKKTDLKKDQNVAPCQDQEKFRKITKIRHPKPNRPLKPILRAHLNGNGIWYWRKIKMSGRTWYFQIWM